MATIEYAHISLNSKGEPNIAGTRAKVRTVAMDHIGHGWDGEEIHRQYPHLTLRQIHSALAYYYDHRAELDAEITQDLKEADRIIAEIDSLQDRSRLKAKLKAGGPVS